MILNKILRKPIFKSLYPSQDKFFYAVVSDKNKATRTDSCSKLLDCFASARNDETPNSNPVQSLNKANASAFEHKNAST
ncbi:hypothetical protein A8135_03940 [Legionella jamestowniensis]|uniref:Uncharacterized protein n=1 Tax=Legionella jamestowniensis TaxID=455 RepID=A0ABX2XRL4_9GAMM|nr:hypothetical protein A8135_03940 [Legionella jamestowniensis]